MDQTLTTLIHHATLAPSGHNTQPWRFSFDHRCVRIYPDLTRRLPIVDPDDHALYISLGCALENLVIAAAHHGLTADVEYFPTDEQEDCLRVRLTQGSSNTTEDVDALFRAIPVRQSNRQIYEGNPITDSDLNTLLDANIYDTVALKAFRPDAPDAQPIIEFVKEGNRAQFNDAAFVNELVSWIRFSKRETHTSRDGLSARALGFPPIPRWLGKLIMTKLVTPEGEATRQEKAIRSSSFLTLFIAREHDKRHWVDLGRSFERVALTATALGIAHAHVNMPWEVELIRRQLAVHLGLNHGEQPLLLIRLGYAKPLPIALRRLIADVIRDI